MVLLSFQTHNMARSRPRRKSRDASNLNSSVSGRIGAAAIRSEESQALYAALQFGADLLGARDEVVNLEELLLLFDFQIERHDQRICERIKANGFNFRHRHLIGKI